MSYGFHSRRCGDPLEKKQRDGGVSKALTRALCVSGKADQTGLRTNNVWLSQGGQSRARPGFKDGGLIRGPGTGISDSIPRDMRKGSFIMPADSTAFFGARELAGLSRQAAGLGNHADYRLTPEQVYTIGWNVLDAMRRSTHTPAVLQALLARHHRGRLGYDDGTTQNPAQPPGESAGSTVPTAGGNPGLGTNTTNVGNTTPQGAYTAPLRNNALPGSGNDVVRNGNSYWGTNVSGPVTINGQAPTQGTFNSVSGGSGSLAIGTPVTFSVPQVTATSSGPSGGNIANPSVPTAASLALSAASHPYAGSPNGQLTANQLHTLQGLATNDMQERNTQLTSQTMQNNAALQAGTQMAQIEAENRRAQQRFAAATNMPGQQTSPYR